MTITTPHAKAKVSLKPQKLVSKIAGLVLATISATSAALPTFLMLSDTASAANSCQCTDYVSRKFGNFRYPAHAGDWDTNVLPQAGFSRLPGVQVGAVVVMERSFPGSNSQFGHVGIVESILPDGRINVRGANQFVGGGLFTEVNCLNVRVTTFRTSVTGRNDVSFWRRGGGGVIDGVRQVNFSARTAPGGVNVRSGPSTSHSIVRTIGGNQTVYFDAWTYGQAVNDIWLGQPDARWYRIGGTNQWIASAVVWGNAPDSRPMP